MSKIDRISILLRVGLSALLCGLGLSWSVTPASAGTPSEFDVSGKNFDFIAGASVFLEDLQFLYGNILELDGGGCLQGKLDDVAITDNLFVDYVDYEDDGPTPGIDLDVSTDDGIAASATFRVDFLYDADCDPETDNAVPAQLTNLCVHITDIDGQQFAGFLNPSTYSISSQSVLQISNQGGFLTASETEGLSSDSEDPIGDQEKFWLQVKYNSTSSIQFRVGIDSQEEDGASFSVEFSCAKWEGDVVESAPSSGVSVPSIDLDHYLRRAEAENALPDTK